METLWQDVRHGIRMLRMRPGFTTAGIVTLAIGIGANTAIFGAVHAMLLAPLPIAAADQVVYGIALREGFDPFGTSFLEYSAYRDSSRSFAVQGLSARRSFTLAGHDQPERLDGAEVTTGFMDALGVSPALGRLFTVEEHRSGGPAVAVIGADVWQGRFGGDRAIVGATVRLDDRGYTIVGVMPPGFDYPARTRIWVPMQRDIDTAPMDQRAAQAYGFVGRLRPGVAVADADRELKEIATRLEKDYPDYRKGWSYTVIPLRQQLLGDLSGRVRSGLLLLATAVGFVLLICCANVASLLIVRSVAREREIAIRLTLGAGRARVVRQLTIESVLLAVVAGVVGTVLAMWIAPVLVSLNPVRIESLGQVLTDFRPNRRILAFAFVISLMTGVSFGIVPAMKLGRVRDLMSVLRRREQRAGGAATGRRMLSAVIVLEVATAVTLLAGGSLVIKSFQRLQHVELGFDPEHLLVLQVTPSSVRYGSHELRTRFVEEAAARIKVLPGVSMAGLTTNIPLETPSLDSGFTVEGQPLTQPGAVPITAHRVVTPEYLATIGVSLLKGRLLEAQDRAGAAPVVVVSEEFARQAWPGEGAIGKRVRRGGPSRRGFPWLTVVGVVGDVKEDLFNFRIPRPVWYLPYSQVDNTLPLSLVIRTASDPAAITSAVRQALHALDPDLPISAEQTMNQHLRGVTATERFSAVLMSAFALIGLGLAALGLYTVIAYSVTQRTSEIGLRMALGSQRHDVLGMVLREGAALVGFGLIIGLAGARALTRTIAGSLYNVSPDDVGTLVLVVATLVTVGIGACAVPAWRATRIDPLIALRND